EREEHAEDAHLQIETRAPDDAGEDVAAEIVGAQQMRAARRQQRGGQVLLERIVRRQPGRGEGDEEPEQAEPGAGVGEARGRAETVVQAEDRGRHGSIRGSRATVATSTMKFVSTTPMASIKVTACTTRWSRAKIDDTNRLPRPGIENTFSTTTVPPISQPTFTPSRL